jgi:hypothetical protein
VESVSFPRSQPRQCFLLYEFFVQLRKSIFDITEKFRFFSDEDYVALGRVFKPDQQYMIEQVRAASLVDITEVWRAPNGGLCSAKGLAMCHHSWLTSAATIRSHLAYGNVHAFATAVCKPTTIQDP